MHGKEETPNDPQVADRPPRVGLEPMATAFVDRPGLNVPCTNNLAPSEVLFICLKILHVNVTSTESRPRWSRDQS